MFRNLKAVEIAEGALLADIAVLFQLLSIYLPIGGQVFRILTFIVFTVLVLRRGLYVGIMGLCVALFVVTIIVGTQSVIDLLLECMGGLFLGVTMKWRMPLLPLLLLGVTSGALAFYALVLISFYLRGPIKYAGRCAAFNLYDGYCTFIDGLAAHAGLSGWWRHSLYPPVSSLADCGVSLLDALILYWIMDSVMSNRFCHLCIHQFVCASAWLRCTTISWRTCWETSAPLQSS